MNMILQKPSHALLSVDRGRSGIALGLVDELACVLVILVLETGR